MRSRKALPSMAASLGAAAAALSREIVRFRDLGPKPTSIAAFSLESGSRDFDSLAASFLCFASTSSGTSADVEGATAEGSSSPSCLLPVEVAASQLSDASVLPCRSAVSSLRPSSAMSSAAASPGASLSPKYASITLSSCSRLRCIKFSVRASQFQGW